MGKEEFMLAMHHKCNVYRENQRCPNMAEVWLIAPDGEKCPGGLYCKKCGNEIVKEFREKIGEKWSLVKVIYV